MFITIITICLNDLQGLMQTCESVKMQKDDGFEHIIIDGGSTDGSVDYIKSYANSKVKWISEGDKGRSDAFNKGIKMARESLILCLNAGDCFADDNVIKDVLDDWNKYKTDVLCYPVEKKDGKIMKPSESSWEKGLLAHQGLFVLKKVYDSIGDYNIYLSNRMDYDFFYRLAKNNCSHYISNRIVSIFDMNGITTYSRNNFKIEGAAVRLIYDKDKFISDVIEDLMYVTNANHETENDYDEAAIRMQNEDRLKKGLLVQWMRNIQNGKKISVLLKNSNLHSASIYGCGEIGRLVAAELKSMIEVKEFIDQKADEISDKEYSVVSLEKMNLNVDAVIVSILSEEDSIVENIKSIYSGQVISIRKLVAETAWLD